MFHVLSLALLVTEENDPVVPSRSSWLYISVPLSFCPERSSGQLTEQLGGWPFF